MTDSLVNRGVAEVGHDCGRSDLPIMVVGVARGGTSMVAGVLSALGVFMGDRASAPVYEDVRLAEAFEKGDSLLAARIASEYTARGQQWGWKRPSSVNYLDRLEQAAGPARYIFVFKDVFSIANRNSISMLADILPGISSALVEYGKMIEFLRRSNRQTLLVSYDKAMRYPQEFVRSVAEFCGINLTDELERSAVAVINPEPEQYLDMSRTTKAQGRLGGVANRNTVFGWARNFYSRTPVTVDILVNDRIAGSVVADRHRPDLETRFGQNCAFRFELPPGVSLESGDLLRARVKNEVRDLENCPLRVGSETGT